MRKSSLFQTLLPTVGALAFAALVLRSEAAEFTLALPTDNNAIYQTAGGPEFYMYVDREFEGENSKPWQGGQYGFVRNPRRTAGGMVFTRFHEGIDIRPVRRDAAGEPLDLVRAVDEGRVVYVTGPSARSGYGKYVVVEHQWEDSLFYTLYAHLNRIDVSIGDRVRQGSTLGLLGYTGSGINRERAHLHFEVNLFLNSKFEDWHTTHFPGDPNHHGIYNGINLAGVDVARLLVEKKRNPNLSIRDFVRSEPAFFSVGFSSDRKPEILSRYPWLQDGQAPLLGARGWTISFTAAGLPVRAAPLADPPAEPTVTVLHPSNVPHRHRTRGLIEGAGKQGTLSESGLRHLRLLTL